MSLLPTASVAPPHFSPAPQPDIVRALQKDEYFIAQFSEDVKDVATDLIGSNRSSQLEDELDLLTEMCYHTCTTLIGAKTLGEEYSEILPIRTDLVTPPSLGRRVMMMCLQLFTPYAVKKLQRRAAIARLNWDPDAQDNDEEENDVNNNNNNNNSLNNSLNSSSTHGSRSVSQLWKWLALLALKAEGAIGYIGKWHLALFYLSGRYLQISRRLTGVRYVYLRKLELGRPGYELLGILLFIQLMVTGGSFSRDFLRRWFRPGVSRTATTDPSLLPDDVTEEDGLESKLSDSDDDDGPECMLCLSPRVNTTATECGHLFCWSCITQCISNKPECPLCRTPCEPHRLLRLAGH